MILHSMQWSVLRNNNLLFQPESQNRFAMVCLCPETFFLNKAKKILYQAHIRHDLQKFLTLSAELQPLAQNHAVHPGDGKTALGMEKKKQVPCYSHSTSSSLRDCQNVQTALDQNDLNLGNKSEEMDKFNTHSTHWQPSPSTPEATTSHQTCNPKSWHCSTKHWSCQCAWAAVSWTAVPSHVRDCPYISWSQCHRSMCESTHLGMLATHFALPVITRLMGWIVLMGVIYPHAAREFTCILEKYNKPRYCG